VKLSLTGLKQLCLSNVVELKFDRRRPQGYTFLHRRMLCTLDPVILNSQSGIEILNFKKPTMPPPYAAEPKNLLTVWDIIMQDWRNIPIENTNVIATVPTKPPEKFWEYFNKVIVKMTSRQKANFINK
jgi:hypothetical protein